MAVTQISRIQHRRGLEQDLPQLTSAELGWSLDTRRLYIGNGTIEEGAPIVGVTRILTEQDFDELASNLSLGISNTQYTFVGNAAGYSAQTGPSALAPVVRNYQQKFDDIINIRDFGAVGDNSTDDTSPTFKMMEDGSDTNSREEVAQLASRQEKFIKNLENALLRIMNKTYGVCRVTGQLIPKERLRLVPHATLSIEAKNMQ